MNNDLSLYICRGDVCTRVNLGNKNGRNNLRNNGRENYDDDLLVDAYTEEKLANLGKCTVFMVPTQYAPSTIKRFDTFLTFPRVNGVLYARIVGNNGENILYTPVTKEMLNDLNTTDYFPGREGLPIAEGILYAKYFNSPYDKYYSDIDKIDTRCSYDY